MEVFVDNESYTPAEPPPETIDALVAQIKPRLADRERIIVTIRCNDQPVKEQDVDTVMRQSPTQYQRLDFETAGLMELAVGAMEAAQVILSETRLKQDQAIELLSQDHNGPAVEALAECIGGWSQSHEAVIKTISLLGIEIDHLMYDGKKIVDILGEVAHQLTQLKECLQTGDFVLLNDLLQYEIAPWFDQWEGVVESITNEIRQRVSA